MDRGKKKNPETINREEYANENGTRCVIGAVYLQKEKTIEEYA